MLRRKAYDALMEWKGRKHDCLLIKGQRQVGKTYIVEHFAKENYAHFVNINLSVEKKLQSAFEGDLDVNTIIRYLKLHINPNEFVPGSTLIFLDEIQDCPNARTSLKSFSLDGRYDVIASGSLLGVTNSRNTSKSDELPPLLPVGYEEHLTMHSLDFEEFLWAIDIPEDIISEIKSSIEERTPIDNTIFDAINLAFRDFMIVGGMPDAVQAFVDNGDYSVSENVLEKILATCKNDITRYSADTNAMRTIECFDSIPSQLSESNKRFTFSRVDGGKGRVSADRYRDNLLWIQNAGYGNFCRSLRQPVHPLSGQTVRDMFKVYLSDTGMLAHMMGIGARRAIYDGDTSYNMGALTENIVAECLMKCGYPICYYKNDNGHNRMEIDFVLEFADGIVAVEVKSGKDRNAPSLLSIGKVFDIKRKIMLERSNIRVDDDGVEHYPLFAAAFINSMETPWNGPAL